jgi:hypothetical protein
MAVADITTTAGLIASLVDEWARHDAILNRLTDEKWDSGGTTHPSFIRCCEIERRVRRITPATGADREARARLLKACYG